MYINCTPHIIRLNDGTEYPVSDNVARVESQYKPIGNDKYRVHYGDIVGLPNRKRGVQYIVSNAVLCATGRLDIVAPATNHPDTIRVDGQIYSVPGFVVNNNKHINKVKK